MSMPAAKGIVVLDKTASVRRTKNVRYGFEYCIRIDAPNSATSLAGTKSWPKLVMALGYPLMILLGSDGASAIPTKT